MVADLISRYRLSRASVVRRRAHHRILKSQRLARVRFSGEEVVPKQLAERRREARVSLQLPVYLRPAIVRGLTIVSDSVHEPLLAVTQNISLGGLGLVHDHPLPTSWFLAEFDVFQDEPLVLLVQSRWTREVEPWSFRTGGRIAGVCRPV